MTIKNLIRKSEAYTKTNQLLKRGFAGPAFNEKELTESLTLLLTQKMPLLRKTLYGTDGFGDVFHREGAEGQIYSYYYKWKVPPIGLYQRGIHSAWVATEDRLELRRFKDSLPYFLINFCNTLNIYLVSEKPLTLSDSKTHYTEVQGGIFKAIHDNSHLRMINAIKECIEDLCDYRLETNVNYEGGGEPVGYATCEKVGDYYQHHLTLQWYSGLRVESTDQVKTPSNETENYAAYGKDADLIKAYQEWAESVP